MKGLTSDSPYLELTDAIAKLHAEIRLIQSYGKPLHVLGRRIETRYWMQNASDVCVENAIDQAAELAERLSDLLLKARLDDEIQRLEIANEARGIVT